MIGQFGPMRDEAEVGIILAASYLGHQPQVPECGRSRYQFVGGLTSERIIAHYHTLQTYDIRAVYCVNKYFNRLSKFFTKTARKT